MIRTTVASSLAPVAGAARPCAAAGAGSVMVGHWSHTFMTLKRNGYGDNTARPRRPRKRPS